MASFYTSALRLVFLVLLPALAPAPAAGEMTLTVVNNCPFRLCPAIQPNAGHPVLQGGGFCLETLTHCSFPVPAEHWSGRVWGRTGCSGELGRLSCATGDCGGRLECGGLGGATPATLAQLTLHHGGRQDLTAYGVSLVDGFNVGMTVTPHEGRGRCPVVGCRSGGGAGADRILADCPAQLQARGARGEVVGCKSGCEAFGTDELCCRNMYSRPETCRASTWSEFFKRSCPETYTYAHDSPSLTHDCAAPRELKIIFCH